MSPVNIPRFTFFDDEDLPETKRQRIAASGSGRSSLYDPEGALLGRASQDCFIDKENIKLENQDSQFLKTASEIRRPMFRPLSTPPDSSPLMERRERVRPPKFGLIARTIPSNPSVLGALAAQVLQRRSKLLSLHPNPDHAVSAPAISESDRKYGLHTESNAAVAKYVDGGYVYVVDMAGSRNAAVVAIGKNFRIRTPRIDSGPFGSQTPS